MRILDRYIAKNYLIGYFIAFCVLMGMRIIIDLFVNLDEFTEHADLSTLEIAKNILVYYGQQSTLYFRDFSGMIIVVAAVFALGRMIRSHELVAMMASGVSLKRVIAPIFLLSLLITGLLVIDQEFIIPPLQDQLVRSHDDLPGQETYDVDFISDSRGSLICAQNFVVETSTMTNPTIILRRKRENSQHWVVTGRISADKAVYNTQTGNWDLVNGRLILKDVAEGIKSIDTYETDLDPKVIPVRSQANNLTFLSLGQLNALMKQGAKVKDLAALYSEKQFRITDPIINMVMLMLALPLLVCRDPKATKSATMLSFALTTACFLVTFLSKLAASEMMFGLKPEIWAWLPIFIFLPIAFIELDSMKT